MCDNYYLCDQTLWKTRTLKWTRKLDPRALQDFAALSGSLAYRPIAETKTGMQNTTLPHQIYLSTKQCS